MKKNEWPLVKILEKRIGGLEKYGETVQTELGKKRDWILKLEEFILRNGDSEMSIEDHDFWKALHKKYYPLVEKEDDVHRNHRSN